MYVYLHECKLAWSNFTMWAIGKCQPYTIYLQNNNSNNNSNNNNNNDNDTDSDNNNK